VHDLDFLDHPERTRAEIRRDYPQLVPQHARRADLVVTNSRYTATQASDRLGVAADRIVVCRPGAPASARRAEPKAVGPILFVGTIEPRKNLDMLFRAYARVLSKRPDAPPLLLAGRTVEQSAAILGPLSTPPLAGHARHLGYVDAAVHRQLMEEASMLVMPSLEEGFGIPALEAMAAGVPVVASRRGALPEVVGDAGLLVDATDDAAFAAAIEALLSEPQRRVAQAEAGVQRAREFTWKDSAAQLLAAYRAAGDRQRGVKARS
jgi:glycosyltransferase involved in cell wall biosynthesis